MLPAYGKSPPARPMRRRSKYGLHQKFVNMCHSSSSEVLLIGDSLVKGLGSYKSVRNKYFHDALNFGIGGDRTENVLWRVENGEVPKCMKY